jgi:hypothetical protein
VFFSDISELPSFSRLFAEIIFEGRWVFSTHFQALDESDRPLLSSWAWRMVTRNRTMAPFRSAISAVNRQLSTNCAIQLGNGNGYDFVPNSRHKSVLHLRDEGELVVFVNAHEQRIETTRSGNVAANDELLLSVRAVLNPRA